MAKFKLLPAYCKLSISSIKSFLTCTVPGCHGSDVEHQCCAGTHLSDAPQQTTQQSIDTALAASQAQLSSSSPDAQEADASMVPSTAQQDPQIEGLKLPAADGDPLGHISLNHSFSSG